MTEISDLSKRVCSTYIKSTTTAFLLVFSTWILATERAEIIMVGDYLFVHAEVIGCNSEIRIVEVGEVLDSGEVTLFEEITLNAKNRSLEDVTKEFVAIWNEKFGQQSKTIQMSRETDSESAAVKMLMLYQLRESGCGESLPDDFDAPGWQSYDHFAGAAKPVRSEISGT